jgi:hypothetical protein
MIATGRLFRILLLLIVAITACDDRGHDARSEFVRNFVASIYKDTSFFRESFPHMPANAAREMNTYRTMMTEEFEIVRYDKFLGSYEYYVKFSNGSYGLVYLSETDGAIIARGFHVYSSEWGG